MDKPWDKTERRSMPNDTDQIKKDINAIAVEIGKISTKIENLHADRIVKHDELMALLTKHDETLNGNGHPGLKTRVSNLERLYDLFKSLGRNVNWGFGIMITLFVTLLGWTVFKK